MSNLTIGEVATRAGIKASAIRYYESVNLIPLAPRNSGQRQYDETVLTRLKIIELAKSFDFSLEEIRLFFEGVSEESAPSEVWRAFAKAKIKVLQAQVERAEHLHRMLEIGLTCQCLKLSDCTLTDVQNPQIICESCA